MSRFKVGDKVVVKSKEEIQKSHSYCELMDKWCEKVLTIQDGIEIDNPIYSVEENILIWDEGMLNPYYSDLGNQDENSFVRLFQNSNFVPLSKNTDPTFSIDFCNMNGIFKKENKYMNKSEIKTVRSYNDRAMVMQFFKKDRDWRPVITRCEVQDGDTFDLDEGIKTCLLKYLLGGHKQYMQIMDAARKVYKRTMEADKKVAEEKENKKSESVLNGLKKIEADMKRKGRDTEILVNAIKKALAEYDKERKTTEEERK